MVLGRARSNLMVVCTSLLVVRRVRIDGGCGNRNVESGGEEGVGESGEWVTGGERVVGREGGGVACVGFVLFVGVVCLGMRVLCLRMEVGGLNLISGGQEDRACPVER